MPESHNFASLKRAARKNPIVAAFMTEWESGGYTSLEQCLIGMACHLAEENERMKKQIFEMTAKGRIPTPQHVHENPFGVSDLRPLMQQYINAKPFKCADMIGLEEMRSLIEKGPMVKSASWNDASTDIPTPIADLKKHMANLDAMSSPLTHFTASSVEAAEAFMEKHPVTAVEVDCAGKPTVIDTPIGRLHATGPRMGMRVDDPDAPHVVTEARE